MALKLTWEESTQLQRRKNCRQLRRILTQLLKDIAERDFLPLLFHRKSPAMKEKEFKCIPKCRRTFSAISSLQPVLPRVLKLNTTVLSIRTSSYFMWGQIKLVLVFRLPFWIFNSQHWDEKDVLQLPYFFQLLEAQRSRINHWVLSQVYYKPHILGFKPTFATLELLMSVQESRSSSQGCSIQ